MPLLDMIMNSVNSPASTEGAPGFETFSALTLARVEIDCFHQPVSSQPPPGDQNPQFPSRDLVQVQLVTQNTTATPPFCLTET